MYVTKRKYNETLCPICMKSIKSNSALNTCLHEFCLECIGHWINIRVSCPMCKQTPKYLLYNLVEEKYISYWMLTPKFKEIWSQRSLILQFFESKTLKMKKLRKSLRILLKNFSYNVEFLRKMIYFCNMKTNLKRGFKSEWDPKHLIIDPGHKIWQWLNIELAVFYTTGNVYRYIKILKEKVSCYKTLKKEISLLFPEPILTKFLGEIETFLSFRESCENFFYMEECKMISCCLDGQKVDSIVIDDGAINLRLFCTALVNKIFQFEHKEINVDMSDLMPLAEISHIKYLTDMIIDNHSIHKENCISSLIEFVSLRNFRSIGNFGFRGKLNYKDHFNFDPEYKYVFLTCLKEQLEQSSYSELSSEMIRSNLDDISCHNSKKTVIDLTDDYDS